jgi:hypothetical protein
MLIKYPGLTLVGGLAMAFAVWVGAATFEFVTQVLHPTLPLEDGHQAEYPTPLVMTRQNSAEGAVETMRRGIRDYAEL